MSFITESQHGTFLKCLDGSIQKIDAQPCDADQAQQTVAELKENFAMLVSIYSAYHNTSHQLRALVEQYNQVQRKTRVKLRVLQKTHIKQLS